MTATPIGRLAGGTIPGIHFRPATAQDVPRCGVLWREALNDYMGRLGLPEIPDELGPIRRLHAHLHATDPERFWVALDEDRPNTEPVAFGAAVRREQVWFLSMLFVRPGRQGRGIGRELLARILPGDDATLATGTDSAQPISNALYAGLGIVPRMPLLSLIGYPERREALGSLPGGVTPVPFSPAASDSDALADTLAALDREVAGFAHPEDHAFLRTDDRGGFVYRDSRGEALGYGYATPVGRVGPVAVRDQALLTPVIGHLLSAVPPRGASAVWAPGDATGAVVGLLRAGLRIDGFPVLLCWNRPFADFSRYIPISPGLL